MTGSPDSMISSSSPETGFGEEEKPQFPMLRPIEPPESESETRTSPTVPLLQPTPVKWPPFMIKQEKLTAEEMRAQEMRAHSAQVDIKQPLNVQIPPQKGKQELDSALSAYSRKDSRSEIDSISGLSKAAKDSSADAEVSVTLTLSAKAAEDIGGVLSAIADLLKIAAPPTYEVSRSPSPDQQFKANLKRKTQGFFLTSDITLLAILLRKLKTIHS